MLDDLLKFLHLTGEDDHLLLRQFEGGVYFFVKLFEVIEGSDPFEIFLELVVLFLVNL